MFRSVLASMVLLTSLAFAVRADEATWRAGVAKVNITPELPIWLSGYGARTKPATEKLDDLWVKALVLEAGGQRAVLVQMDVIGVDRDLSQEICKQIEAKYQLPRASVALCTSSESRTSTRSKRPLESLCSMEVRKSAKAAPSGSRTTARRPRASSSRPRPASSLTASRMVSRLTA